MTCPQPRCHDCGASKIFARERCNPCYTRHKRALKRAGTYEPLRIEGSTKHRLLAHVTPGWGGCVLRTTGIDRDGYSLIRESEGVTRRAHRVAYEMFVGPIPDGLQLDHVCHNRDLTCLGGRDCRHRRCINPHHLEPVTNRENQVRGVRGRKTHCKRGHEFTEANTRRHAGGRRACRACDAIRTRKYLARKAARAAGVTS